MLWPRGSAEDKKRPRRQERADAAGEPDDQPCGARYRARHAFKKLLLVLEPGLDADRELAERDLMARDGERLDLATLARGAGRWGLRRVASR